MHIFFHMQSDSLTEAMGKTRERLKRVSCTLRMIRSFNNMKISIVFISRIINNTTKTSFHFKVILGIGYPVKSDYCNEV